MSSPVPNRAGRMNRSRWIAAGTSVSALVALTAGVAAANPAPSGTQHRAVSTTPDVARPEVPPTPEADDSGTWRQLPPAPGYQYQPPQSDTRSGGS